VFANIHSMRRVFIAEDAPDVRETLVKILEHQGFTIAGTANTEAAALDWLRQNEGRWELAIIDLLLKEGTGFNVLRQFRHSANPGKLVVYSGFVTELIRSQCQKLGAHAVISKMDVMQLQQVLDAFGAGNGQQ
jgi:DNA-binding NarL/FixJ family response regulator